MKETNQPSDRFTREALILWRAEGCRTASDADVVAFIDDANAFAREENARDWRTEPMITRATVSLPGALVGIRLFDEATGNSVGAHFRTGQEQMQPCSRAAAQS